LKLLNESYENSIKWQMSYSHFYPITGQIN
jgi:hypothetical protein